MKLSSFEILSISLSLFEQKYDLTDDFISKLAVTLRKEYPQRKVKDDFYIAFDDKERRAFVFGMNTVNIREDRVQDFEISLEFLYNTLLKLSELLEITESIIGFKLDLRLSFESDINSKVLSVQKFMPTGVNHNAILGDIESVSSVINFVSGKFDYQLNFSPDVENEKSINIDCMILSQSPQNIKETKSSLLDTKLFVEGMIKEIVKEW